jgi:hypothetical protein
MAGESAETQIGCLVIGHRRGDATKAETVEFGAQDVGPGGKRVVEEQERRGGRARTAHALGRRSSVVPK